MAITQGWKILRREKYWWHFRLVIRQPQWNWKQEFTSRTMDWSIPTSEPGSNHKHLGEKTWANFYPEVYWVLIQLRYLATYGEGRISLNGRYGIWILSKHDFWESIYSFAKTKKGKLPKLNNKPCFPRALSRTWTLLAESVEPGSTLLRQHTVRLVSHDGWCFKVEAQTIWYGLEGGRSSGGGHYNQVKC